jgi:hypothetical protein
MKPLACKVFSVTLARDRAVIGESITEWLRKNEVEVVSCYVRQSSDSEFHCLSFVIFYR